MHETTLCMYVMFSSLSARVRSRCQSHQPSAVKDCGACGSDVDIMLPGRVMMRFKQKAMKHFCRRLAIACADADAADNFSHMLRDHIDVRYRVLTAPVNRSVIPAVVSMERNKEL